MYDRGENLTSLSNPSVITIGRNGRQFIAVRVLLEHLLNTHMATESENIKPVLSPW